MNGLALLLVLLLPPRAHGETALTPALAAGTAQLKQTISPQSSSQALFKIVTIGGKSYLELTLHQIEAPFLLSGTIDRAAGDIGLFAQTSLGAFVFSFHWDGDKIEAQRHSGLFRAEPETPLAKAVETSIAPTILAKLPVISSDSVKGWVRIPAEPLFLADLFGLQAALRGAGALSAADGRLESLASYPANLEAQTRLLLVQQDARRPISIHYSVSALPGDNGFKPRSADGRVGYFATQYLDLTRPDLANRVSPIATVIARWNLQKSDPSAEVSDVKNPIVYWIDSTVPEAYRAPIKAGLLAWNAAFEAAGFRNALVVKDVDRDMAPEERASYSPASAAYNVVRWFVGNNASFAQGPPRINPLTGEIFNATIRFGDQLVRSVLETHDAGAPQKKEALPGLDDFARQAALEAGRGLALLEARGPLSSAERQRYLSEFLTYVSAHEMGHNLGLRHNFKGSTWLPEDRLGENGYLTASVMDYVPPHIAEKGRAQGPYYQTKVGPYDVWAIGFGYKDATGAELKATAERSGREPALAYGPDEDLSGSGPGIDPDAQVWDLGRGALPNASRHARNAREIWSSLSARRDEDADDFSTRRTFIYGFRELHQAVANVGPLLGGVHVRRGQPGVGQDAYTPVSAQQQRAALKFLDENIFSDRPFHVDSRLLRRLGQERLDAELEPNWPVSISAQVGNLRGDALSRIFDGGVLQRLYDRQELVGGGADVITVGEVLGTVRRSIWKEIEKPAPSSISRYRRNLQDQHLARVAALWRQEGSAGDIRAAALRDLKAIRSNARRALASRKIGPPTRLHLEQAVMTVDQILEPKLALTR